MAKKIQSFFFISVLFFTLSSCQFPEIQLFSISTQASWGSVACLTEIIVSNVTGIKWTPDKLNLAVASINGISLFDKTNHDQVKFIDTDDGLVSFDFSPNGRWLASAH